MRSSYAQPRAVRVLLAAAAVTYVGDEVAAVALALAVHGSGAGGLAVAGLLLAKMMPVVLLAPLAGWAVDRLQPQRALTLASVCGAVVVALLAFTDHVVVWLLGTAVVASAAAVAQPALLVLVPRAAGPESARRAMAWVAVASRSSAATGALLAGAMVHLGGLRLALLVDALTYLVVVLGVRIAAAHLAPAPAAPAAPQEEGRPALAGLRLVRRDPVLRVVLGVLVTAIVFIGISYVAVFFFVPDVLGGGPAATTAVIAAYGTGMTVGCWAAGRLPVHALGPLAVQAPLLVGAGFLAPVLVPALGVAVAGFALAGLASGTALTALRGLVLERVPAHLLGRVWAAESALGVTGELVALTVAGTVVALAGARPAMALCGAGALLAGLAGVVLLRGSARAALLPSAVAVVPAPRLAVDDALAPARSA